MIVFCVLPFFLDLSQLDSHLLRFSSRANFPTRLIISDDTRHDSSSPSNTMKLTFVLPAFLLSAATVHGAGSVTVFNNADCTGNNYPILTQGNGACHNVAPDSNNHGRRGAIGCSKDHCMVLYRGYDCTGDSWPVTSEGTKCGSFVKSKLGGDYDILSVKCGKTNANGGPSCSTQDS